MSPESLQHSAQPVDDESLKALGALIIPRESDESIPVAELLKIKTAITEEEAVSVRTLSMVTTLVKEAFQAIPAKFNADQRDDARAKIREGSVLKIFKTVGAVDKNDKVNDPFSIIYSAAEARISDVTREHLLDLSEKYEDHPAMRAYNMLQRTAPIPDDVVYMRRVSLILLDEYSA